MPRNARTHAPVQNEPTEALRAPAPGPFRTEHPAPGTQHPALPPRHLTAARLLLTQSPGDVARQLGIDPKTLYRWRQNPLFQAELQRLYHAPPRPAAQPVTAPPRLPGYTPGPARLQPIRPTRTGDPKLDAILKQYGF